TQVALVAAVGEAGLADALDRAVEGEPALRQRPVAVLLGAGGRLPSGQGAGRGRCGRGDGVVGRLRTLGRAPGEDHGARQHGSDRCPHSSRLPIAQAVSSCRLDSCSLRSTDDTCVSTVLTEMNSSLATSLYW